MDIVETKRLYNEALSYPLAGVEVFKKFTLEELAAAYNGAGPDSWGDVPRKIVTSATVMFAPVVLWHDAEFTKSDGTKATFSRVASDWEANTSKVLERYYPAWTWKRLLPTFNKERAYWRAIKFCMDKAVKGDSAYSAWVAAHFKHSGKDSAKA